MLMVGAAGDEFDQISNMEVMKFFFVIRDLEHIHMMGSVSMLERLEREDLLIFKD